MGSLGLFGDDLEVGDSERWVSASDEFDVGGAEENMKPLKSYEMLGVAQKVPNLGIMWDKKNSILMKLGVDPFDQEIPNGFREVSWTMKILVECSLRGGTWFPNS